VTFDQLAIGDRFHFAAFRTATLRKVDLGLYVLDSDPNSDTVVCRPETEVIRLSASGSSAGTATGSGPAGSRPA
jgi:hypothetical protein